MRMRWGLRLAALVLHGCLIHRAEGQMNRKTSAPTSRPSSRPSDQPSRRKPSQAPSAVVDRTSTETPTHKETLSPITRSPSPQPTIRPSSKPSRAPAPLPTLEPTNLLSTSTPTNTPTSEPSEGKTDTPTSLPSTRPTMWVSQISPSGAPTQLYSTSYPTVRPTTDKPSFLPSQDPISVESNTRQPSTQQPFLIEQSASPIPQLTSEPTDYMGTILPMMIIDIAVVSPGESLEFDKIRAVMNRFFFDFFASGIRRATFESIQLQVDIPTQRTMIMLSGKAYFGGDTKPTADDLKGELSTYFSFWGVQDIIQVLIAADVPVQSVTFWLNGVILKSNEIPNRSATPEPVAGENIPMTTSSNNKWYTRLFVGVALGGASLLMILAFVIHRTLVAMHMKTAANGRKVTSNQSGANVDVSDEKVAVTSPPESSSGIEGDIQSQAALSEMYSAEDSYFAMTVSNASQVKGPPSDILNMFEPYDVHRLDRIISQAKAEF